MVQDGSCGEWSDWTTCSISCMPESGSAGQRSRSRPCNPPRNGGLPCDCSDEHQPCAGPSGNFNICPVDFEWSAWTSWSSCSAFCGEGTAHRVRRCTEGRHGGDICPRPSETEDRGCSLKECPRCNTTPWSSWSSCSTTCGGGTEKRHRNLTEADPQHPRCDSLEHEESQSCNHSPCRKKNRRS